MSERKIPYNKNIFGKNTEKVSLEDINTLIHSKRHCFTFPEGFREFQDSIIELFKSYQSCQKEK